MTTALPCMLDTVSCWPASVVKAGSCASPVEAIKQAAIIESSKDLRVDSSDAIFPFPPAPAGLGSVSTVPNSNSQQIPYVKRRAGGQRLTLSAEESPEILGSPESLEGKV